jgi:pimeloyl-ACP methyl ester carboxylesterase
MWHYHECGAGRPLILLHGIGMSNAVWNAVVPLLRPTRRVIAFDTAGFGATPPLPRGMTPTVANLVDALARSMFKLGIETPVDIVGNSLGGLLALEAARRGMARSVVAISPAGLWHDAPPRRARPLFSTLRFLSRRIPTLARAMSRCRLGRELTFAVPLGPGSGRMSMDDAHRTVRDFASAAAVETTFEHTRAPFSAPDMAVSLTVVFGGRDWVLPSSARCRTALPPHTRWLDQRAWGHVPMWTDPSGVARLILDATR